LGDAGSKSCFSPNWRHEKSGCSRAGSVSGQSGDFANSVWTFSKHSVRPELPVRFRYVAFQLAEVAVPRALLAEILCRIGRLRGVTGADGLKGRAR
jgi:hypothetical protein